MRGKFRKALSSLSSSFTCQSTGIPFSKRPSDIAIHPYIAKKFYDKYTAQHSNRPPFYAQSIPKPAPQDLPTPPSSNSSNGIISYFPLPFPEPSPFPTSSA